MTTAVAPPPAPGTAVDDAGGHLARLLRATLVSVFDNGSAGAGTPWSNTLVVTNNHVVGGSAPQLVLPDGAVAASEVVFRDEAADLVLLRTSVALPRPLRTRLDPLHAGELVFAIGHPWGERGVLTAGIALAPGGPVQADGRFSPVRADLRLAPGNSGGPLTDAAGQLVGINSMIIGGAGVAIPAAVVAEFVARATAGTPEAGYDR